MSQKTGGSLGCIHTKQNPEFLPEDKHANVN
jgi:hypothetical protein